ncbi:uncharacterized protein PG998_006780 [Apiospora kogelbergensis]|uniref:uncharacterized protein n=1 Tax=Apiospora kogelbergensis TaxID=1337665 RepID=UPI00312E751A
MAMGLCFSCFSDGESAVCEAESRSLPRCEPRPADDHQHTSDGQVPQRSISNSSHSRGLRLIVPPNLVRRDSIDRAMATNPSCGPEDSPTWIEASPLSTKLAFHRDADPDGSKGLEHKDIEKYKQNRSGTAIWEPLGQSKSSCIWDETMVQNMSSGLIVIEARRRVRKYYKEQYDAVRKDLDDDLAARKCGLPDIARRMMGDKEWRKKTAEAIRLTESIAEKKDEATRRVMSILDSRLKEKR